MCSMTYTETKNDVLQMELINGIVTLWLPRRLAQFD